MSVKQKTLEALGILAIYGTLIAGAAWIAV